MIAQAAEEGPSLPEKAVKYRQGAYFVIAWNFGAIGAMVKGEMPFDAKVLAEKAERVNMMTKMLIEGFEVKGSEKGHHTEAKPAVWKDWEKFKEGQTKFQEATAKLAEVAKTAASAEDVKVQFQEVAKMCKDCHENFKED
jgi:cytochrome c556